MEGFWKWLMRANARGILACAVLALVLVSAFWTWREFAPFDERLFATQPGRARPTPSQSIGLLDYIARQLGLERLQAPYNAFLPPHRKRYPRRLVTVPFGTVTSDVTSVGLTRPGMIDAPDVPNVRPPREKPPGDKPPPEPTPAPPPPEPAPAPPPEPPPEPVRLTYRGLFRRPDGKTVVLVEDSRSKRSSFYDLNKDIFGCKIGSANTQRLTVRLADGSVENLPFGKPMPIRGGRHAD